MVICLDDFDVSFLRGFGAFNWEDRRSESVRIRLDGSDKYPVNSSSPRVVLDKRDVHRSAAGPVGGGFICLLDCSVIESSWG